MKNTIKIITYLNRFILGSTLLLYMTVFLGLYAQIVLGAFQVISFLVLLLFYNSHNILSKYHLIIYGCITALYGLSCFIISEYFNNLDEDFFILQYIIIPMLIASFFTYMLEIIYIDTKKN